MGKKQLVYSLQPYSAMEGRTGLFTLGLGPRVPGQGRRLVFWNEGAFRNHSFVLINLKSCMRTLHLPSNLLSQELQICLGVYTARKGGLFNSGSKMYPVSLPVLSGRIHPADFLILLMSPLGFRNTPHRYHH